MGRAEKERRRIQESGSPSGKHSMNQRVLGMSFEGEKRLRVSRKADRIEKNNQERDEYEQAKLQRIQERVGRSFKGDERILLAVLTAEVRYLEKHGVPIPYRGSLYQEGLEFPTLQEIAIAVME